MSARTVWALVGALACALVAMAIWALAFRTGIGQSADVRILDGVRTFSSTRAQPLAEFVSALGNPLPFAALAAALMGWALMARGLAVATVVAALLVVPNLVTQILKRELAEPRIAPVSVEAAAWPSGHATAAMSLALAALLMAPPGWRVPVAVGGLLFAGAMGVSVVLLGWHFPSDAVGGFAIASAGACLAAAALSPRAATAALPSRWRRATG